MITVFHAIQSLVPGAEVSVGIYDQSIVWHKPDVAPVTMDQIKQEQQRLQQAYDWNQYQRNRAREYPSIEEQLDALYHAGMFPPAMAARIQAVKQKYPRDSSVQTQPAEPTTTTMSVEQWLSMQTEVKNSVNEQPTSVPAKTMTVEEWLREQGAQPSTPTTVQKMTREEWLREQVAQPSIPTTVQKMTREEWLEQQKNQGQPRPMTREEWLEQQKNQGQPRPMTREEWLAEQANIGN